MSTPHYHETEVKIAFQGSPEEARARIESCGYTLIEPRTLEADQVFDCGGELRAVERLLRLRRAGDKATVTYKGPGIPGPHKSREEIEFDVSDAVTFTMVLDRLGYQPAFRYEKYRTKFAAAGEAGIVTTDETPIGTYLELEGAPDWIDRTAARLGYSQAEYLTSSYAALYRKYRQGNADAPKDMIFV